jgi:hypothetical protein
VVVAEAAEHPEEADSAEEVEAVAGAAVEAAAAVAVVVVGGRHEKIQHINPRKSEGNENDLSGNKR